VAYAVAVAPTLRQRNRLAAMQRILATAMNLFDERGYREVTVEDIATAAGVSPRTYYRYFGTKEGLFTTDLHAAIGVDLIADHLDPHDLPGSLQRIVEAISTSAAEDDTSWRGMRYVIEEPSVRAAVYATADEISERLATVLRDAGAQPTHARVTARAYLFGVYFGALEQWHLDGRREPLGRYIQRGAEALRVTPA
jgi:AcrR family transcriptional regulator